MMMVVKVVGVAVSCGGWGSSSADGEDGEEGASCVAEPHPGSAIWDSLEYSWNVDATVITKPEASCSLLPFPILPHVTNALKFSQPEFITIRKTDGIIFFEAQASVLDLRQDCSKSIQ